MRWAMIAGIIAALLCAEAQPSAAQRRAAAPVSEIPLPPPDSWETDPAKLPNLQECTELDASRVAPVPGSRRAAAAARLESEAIVPLSGAEASRFGMASHPPQKAFLVRAVAKNERSGAFTARICGTALWTSHGSLGHTVPPSTRVPLVVLLDRPPTNLFVSWSMAQ